MAMEGIWPLSQVRSVLRSADSNIVDRMKAVFYGRFHNSKEAVEVLAEGLWYDSVLVRHEIAYVLGQMNEKGALPICMALLDDKDQHAMVRHEAGEAIAALGITSDEALACLERHAQDQNTAVRETVEVAICGLVRERTKRGVTDEVRDKTKNSQPNFYLFTAARRGPEDEDKTPAEYAGTRDPAEGDPARTCASKIAELGELLRDENAVLYDRYIAMFTLRNINTKEAGIALAAALDEKSSALLRHEICFVLGQMQLPCTCGQLTNRLDDLEEADMVRHEAALALGSVGADIWTKEGREVRLKAIDALTKHTNDLLPVVAESCLCGLHNIEWETGLSNDQSDV